ncbi:unnamed protein product [Rotaria sordida]|uniref:Uncharacterized protein n=1 Tax=Rotaria sordida TaxID=392033 RepID=A0A815FEY0_9BILA|nr:unnamed protein product [Rotaria sordida]
MKLRKFNLCIKWWMLLKTNNFGNNKMRWYCWLIFFFVANLSIWALPTDGDVDEKSLLAVDNENRLLVAEDEGKVDENIIGEDESLIMTDEYSRLRKPHKQEKDKDNDSSESNDDEGNNEDDKTNKKKPKMTKFICFKEKSNRHKLRRRPQQSETHRQHPSSSSSANNLSQRPHNQ